MQWLMQVSSLAYMYEIRCSSELTSGRLAANERMLGGGGVDGGKSLERFGLALLFLHGY